MRPGRGAAVLAPDEDAFFPTLLLPLVLLLLKLPLVGEGLGISATLAAAGCPGAP